MLEINSMMKENHCNQDPRVTCLEKECGIIFQHLVILKTSSNRTIQVGNKDMVCHKTPFILQAVSSVVTHIW